MIVMRTCILFILFSVAAHAQPCWEAVRVAPGDVESLAMLTLAGRTHPLVFAASGGVYRSTDLGESWVQLDPTVLRSETHAVAAIGEAVFALSEDGLRRSMDGGDTWVRLLTGRSPNSIAPFGRTPQCLQHLVVGTIDAILFSNDSGKTWEPRINGFPINWRQARYKHVCVRRPPNSPGHVEIFANGWEDVYTTHDTGRTWHPALPQRNGGAFDMRIEDERMGRIMTAGSRGIRSMHDGSTQWQTLSTRYTRSLAVTSIPEGRLLLAGTDSIGILVSTDGGMHWSARSTALKGRSVYAFAIDPTSGRLMFAGTDSGCFRSTDAGASWAPVNNGMYSNLVYRFTIARDHEGMTSIFASRVQADWVSHDCATTWKPTIAQPSVTEASTTMVECTTQSGNRIVFAGTMSGVWYSRDAGSTWIALNDGLPPMRITGLHLLRTDHCTYLFAESNLRIWKLPLTDLLSE